AIANESRAHERAARLCDARASYAEHVGEKLLREEQLVAFHAIMDHEQPACAAMLERVEPITRCRLRALLEQRLRVEQHEIEQRRAVVAIARKRDVRAQRIC